MPVTHGSASESSDVTVAYNPLPPTLDELTAANPVTGSVLSEALRRARAERRNPRTVPAGFDNNLSDDGDSDSPPRQVTAGQGKASAAHQTG